MNTKKQLNNILNKFPKTELEKVELAGSPQIDKYVGMTEDAIKKIKSNFDALNKIVNEIKSKESELDRQLNTAENNYKAGEIIKKESSKLLRVIKNKAKELGVETNKIRNYDRLRELAEEAVGVSENLYFLQNNSKALRGAIRKI